MKHWIKIPGPGEYRGEGTWYDADQTPELRAEYDVCSRTGFLPTHEGDAPPPEKEQQ